MRHIIIGGVAGGATAAARIRRADEKAEIILVEKGPHISYANCGLPYYIGGTIADKNKLFVQTPESFGRRFNGICILINSDQTTCRKSLADFKGMSSTTESSVYIDSIRFDMQLFNCFIQ